MKLSESIKPDLNLLLIGGTGRSGTSFVYRKILENRDVVGFEEFESRIFTSHWSMIDLFDRYINTYSPERFDAASRAFRDSTLDTFTTVYNNNKIRAYFRVGAQNNGLEKTLDDFINGLQNDRFSNQPLLYSFQRRSITLFEILFKYKNNEDRSRLLLEKTPHNILFFPRIKEIFPNAKILHVIRDPRAIAESLARQSWGPETYRDAVIWVRRILDTWIMQHRQGLFADDSLFCVRAEDLTLNHEVYVEQLRQFTGLQLPSLDLKAQEAALDQWRENISTQDYEFACRELAHIMEFFAYDPALHDSRNQALNTEFTLNRTS